MKKIFKKIKYFLGTIYRGLIGIYHNKFDKIVEIKKEVQWFSIGSTAGGRQIRCYKLSGNSTGSFVASAITSASQDDVVNKFLIVGGIHGNEVGTVKLANRIINYFNDCRDTAVPCFYIIPCLNLDGYYRALENPDYWHRGREGRFNANNVDLNRNFPTQNFEQQSVWRRGKNYAEESNVYCGEYGASEPETQALIKFIQEKGIKNLIILHNVGKDVIINEGDATARQWAGVYQQKAKFKIRYGVELSGSASEWARENKIHYMAVEGSSRWGSDWRRQKKAMEFLIFNF